MNRKQRISFVRFYALWASVLLAVSPSVVLGRTCPDGEHPQIDLKSISIKYETSSLEATLSGLSVFGAKVSVSPKTLQKAAVGTQQMNEFIKGLVVGFNSCAITRIQYQEALERLLPGLQGDAAILEQFRQQMLKERKVDREYFDAVIASYENQLERFARLIGRGIDYERIVAIVTEQEKTNIAQDKKIEGILRRLAELERRSDGELLATPKQVKDKFSEDSAQPNLAMQLAETEYQKGYSLFQRYRFRESIPHLKRAVDTHPLPEFYLALARAYEETLQTDKAERTYRDGIAKARQVKDSSTEARLIASLMFLSIRNSADIGNTMQVFGLFRQLDPDALPDALAVALNQGDLKNAMMVTTLMLIMEGASSSYENVLRKRQELAQDKGENDPQVVMYDAIRVVVLLMHDIKGLERKAKSHSQNLDRDLAHVDELAQLVLEENEKVFGPIHMRVALSWSLLGSVMMEKGDYQSALHNFQKSLKINEAIGGPQHEGVAGDHLNLAKVSESLGDIDTALYHLQTARSWYAGLPAGDKGLEVQGVDVLIAKLNSAKQPAKDRSTTASNGDGVKTVHAFHILLKSEAEAKSIITKLQSSADLEKNFRALAKEYSTGPSSQVGGDLGWFRRKQMVKAFEDAAFSMEPGDFSSQPVETQFGWHVLYVKDKK